MNTNEFSQQKELKEIITDHIKTSAIYCFGKHKITYGSRKTLYPEKEVQKKQIHFYLLVLVHETKENATNDISDKIKIKSQDTVTATILIHTVKNLKHLCDDQQFFFWQIMQKAELFFQDSEKPPYLNSNELPKRNVKATLLYLANRRNTISTLWGWVYNDDDVCSSHEVKMSSLHQIVEQSCLSLIRVFLGYTPSHFSLDHLFNLCEYFSTITTDFFPRKTQEDKSMFKHLKQQPSNLRFSKANDIEYLYYELLEERCRKFKDQADVLIRIELNLLEEIEK